MTARLLRSVLLEDSWTKQAACTDSGVDFFALPKSAEESMARSFCRSRCDVRLQCLRHALDHGERFGVWGGTTEQERQRMARSGRCPHYWPADLTPESVCGGCGLEYGEFSDESERRAAA